MATKTSRALLLLAPLLIQHPAQFKTGIEIARIEVSVLDEQGRPVAGLTPADFTLLENGQPRPIVAFDEVRLAAAGPRRLLPGSDVRSNTANREQRLVVIVLDNSIAGLWALARARHSQNGHRPALA